MPTARTQDQLSEAATTAGTYLVLPLVNVPNGSCARDVRLAGPRRGKWRLKPQRPQLVCTPRQQRVGRAPKNKYTASKSARRDPDDAGALLTLDQLGAVS